jgi:hypothetical protein
MKYLKRFNESNTYYSDDINVDITSTVIDILQDLIDDGLNIQCFTVGYITLKQLGSTYTENDIVLYIMANNEDDIEYKVLDYNELIPYLERIIDYVEGEGRKVDINFQWRQMKKGRPLPFNNNYSLRQMELEYRLVNGEINKDLSSIPDNKYESISMYFKLK